MNMSLSAQAIDEIPFPDDRAYHPGAHSRAFSELEAAVSLVLETYANVHRGNGHHSLVTTHLYEQAREVVLNFLGLDNSRYAVIFCTPHRASVLMASLKPEGVLSLSSRNIGLPLGIRALAVKKDALPAGVPFQTGGGTTRMVSRASVVWEEAPDRFEAGTPAVINAIAFARALQITRRFGEDVFKKQEPVSATAFQILHQDKFNCLSGRELLLHLRQAAIGRGCLVPTADGFRPFVCLDNSASTPTFSPIWDAVCRTWRLPEDQQQMLVALVKDMCARFFGAPPACYDTIFTSNTTEAINLAAKSLEHESAADFEPAVLNTFLEHNSNELPWRFATGFSLVRTPIDDEGFPDLTEFERVLREYNLDRIHGRKRIGVVAVSGASNVLGTCPDLKEISRIAHKYQARVLVDAAQLAGHRKIDMEVDDLDYLAFSGHKMYAPFGTGGLVVRKGLWPSGKDEIEKNRVSGEENAVGIAALGKAIDLLQRIGMDVVREEEQRLTRKALRKLAAVPGIEIYGLKNPDSARFEDKGCVISFGLKHVPHNLVAEKLAEKGGIGVRSGCFCAHLLVKRLLHIHPVREALANLGLKFAPGLTKSLLPGLVRVSFGIENDGLDVNRLVKTLKTIAGERVSRTDRLLARTHNATPFVPNTDVRRQLEACAESISLKVFGSAATDERGLDEYQPVPSVRAPSSGWIILRRACCRKQ